MKIRHLTLFTLRVAHQYYGDIPCRDFDFVLAEHSRQTMAGARLLAGVQEGQLHVSFEADDNGMPVQDIAGTELVIGLRLNNPCFEYFTGALPEPTPFYTNDAAPKTLDAPQAGDLVARRFVPAAATTARPLTLSISRIRDGLPIWQGEIHDGEGMPTIDMHLWEAGCYLVTQQAAGGTHARPLLIAPDLAMAGMWGMARIVVSPDFWTPPAPSAAPQPPDFHIDFASVVETLDYYVVAPKTWANAFDNLAISDTAPNSTLAFDKRLQTGASNDGISPGLLGVPDKSQAVLFRSKHAVPRSAAATLHIQLMQNGNTLIKNLPLPSANTPAARFVVHISKP